ncbi:hypothetical protein Hamer_G026657 [Homarus americanus]|uniref:Uncharacterized protein n=1 Tax=Homarus americanus TaxID=6706 RepID=A0A8J5N1Z4_HOMAM|nr:hypothetical protein Hamer_G026657 [Homarus americanus]
MGRGESRENWTTGEHQFHQSVVVNNSPNNTPHAVATLAPPYTKTATSTKKLSVTSTHHTTTDIDGVL